MRTAVAVRAGVAVWTAVAVRAGVAVWTAVAIWAGAAVRAAITPAVDPDRPLRPACLASGAADATIPCPPSRFAARTNDRVGAWRSLVAHLFWVQGVVSSNLAAPTNQVSVQF